MSAERGFTLIEVLVAFAIAALSVAVLVRAVSTGMLAAHTARNYEEAVVRARSHLAALGRDATLVVGDRSGDDGEGFRWRLSVRPLAAGALPQKAGSPQFGPNRSLTLFAVDVGIAWTGLGGTREIVLHSLRLGNAQARNG